MSSDLQDQLFTSRDQNLELKKSVAQKEEEIRKRNVQIRKLEQQLKNASLVKDPNSQMAVIEQLQREMENLKVENSELANLARKQAQINSQRGSFEKPTPSASSKPLASPFHQTGRPSVVTAHTPLGAAAFQQNGFNSKPGSNVALSTPSHNNQSQIQSLMQAVQPYLQQPSAMPEALASQLASALGEGNQSMTAPFLQQSKDAQIQRLRDRLNNTDQLRRSRNGNENENGNSVNNADKQQMSALLTAFQANNSNNTNDMRTSSDEIALIQQELRDKHARIAQLKTDFIKLKTHMEAERLIQKRALEQCDEYKIMLREKESKLLTLQHALDRHRVQDEQYKQQQVEIDGLKSTNQQLEQHLTSLIASAKYLDDDEQTRLKAVVAEYAKSLDSLNDNMRERDQKIAMLEQTVTSMNKSAVDHKTSVEQLAVAQREIEALKTKLRLYSDDTGIDADAFTKTLDRMRREQEGKPVAQESSVDDIAGLRRKNSEYEQRYKEAVKDAERSSDLLLAQRRLNEQQQKQIHKLQDELQLARGEVALLKKSSQPPSSQNVQKNPTQLLIEADQQLKAQGVVLNQKVAPSITSESMFSVNENQAGGVQGFVDDFNPSGSDQLLAFYVSQVELNSECSLLRHPNDATAAPITFITIDFLHFNSTSSSLLAGWSPAFKFLSQFRVTVDDVFLDYLARDGVLIELWAQKRDISAERVASAKLPLSSMLQRADGRMSGSLALFAHENENDDSKRTDTVVAQVATLSFKLGFLRPFVISDGTARSQ